MDLENYSIILGIVFTAVIGIIRIWKLGSQFFDKENGFIFLGYTLFSFTTASLIVKMTYLVLIANMDLLTPEIVEQYRFYIILAGTIIGLGAIIAVISVIIDNFKKSNPSVRV